MLSQLGEASQRRASLSQGPAISLKRRRGYEAIFMLEDLSSERFGLPCFFAFSYLGFAAVFFFWV